MAQRFLYSQIPKSRIPEAAALLTEYLFAVGNVPRSLGLIQGTQWKTPAKKALCSLLNQDLSLMAIDQINDKVVSVFAQYPICAETSAAQEMMLHELMDIDKRWNMLAEYHHFLWRGENILDILKVDKVVNMYGLGVSSEYAKLGIGHEIVGKCYEMAKESGFDAIFAPCMHAASFRILENLKFETYTKRKMSEFQIDGKSFITNPKDDFQVGIMYKFLKLQGKKASTSSTVSL